MYTGYDFYVNLLSICASTSTKTLFGTYPNPFSIYVNLLGTHTSPLGTYPNPFR